MKKLAALLLVYLSIAIAQGQTKPTLDQLIDEALRNNLSLIAERYNVPIAEARILQAGLRPNPTLLLQYQYIDAFARGFSADKNPAGPPEGDAGIMLPIVRGGKRAARIETTGFARQSVEADFLDTSRNLILSVQMAFLEHRLAEDQLALLDASRRAFEQIVNVNQARVNAGEIARVEFIRSRVALLSYQNQTLQAEERFRQAKFRLQSVVGRPEIRLDFDVDGEFRRDAGLTRLEDFVTRALEGRPDLISLRRDADRARSFAKLQRALSKPDWTVQAWFNRQYNIGITNGSSLTFQWNVPLPVNDRNQGEIARAEQEILQTQSRIRALEQSIRHELGSAYSQYDSARGILSRIEGEMLLQAAEVRDTTEYSYRRGEATLIEFLDAQRAYDDTQLAHTTAQAEVARSLYVLDSLSGTGRP